VVDGLRGARGSASWGVDLLSGESERAGTGHHMTVCVWYVPEEGEEGVEVVESSLPEKDKVSGRALVGRKQDSGTPQKKRATCRGMQVA
jgi:hypothetical protein